MSRDGDFFRDTARRCRQLGLRARTEAARRQLFDWADRFEALAKAQTQPPKNSQETRWYIGVADRRSAKAAAD